jgi:hypothetical protein
MAAERVLGITVPAHQRQGLPAMTAPQGTLFIQR